jgi:predicted Zn finger-like uncharacterized protein
MAMVVECESCRSRFRLSDSLLKKSKAVRFRCRKCGGSILVRNPHAPPVVPVSAVSAEIAARPVAATDISAVVRPEIEPPAPRETPVPPPPADDPSNAVPAPPALPVPKVPRLEDLVLLSPGKDVIPREASTRRKPSPGRDLLVAGLSILLLAGVVLYFGTTKAGQELLGQWFPSWGSPLQAITAAKPAYDVREVKSTVHEYAVAGNLFVVSGTVVNVGNGTSRGIRMRAVLFGGDNQVLVENSSLAGNLIDEPTLRHMIRNPIEVYLKMEHREEGDNRDIPPGKSLPFMVVFFNPPGKIGNFTVHAADVD